jgi:tetratricopeptide (TPR) repeat protein
VKQICFALLVGITLASAAVVPTRAQSVESLFGAAQHQEEVEGNLKAAIDSYQKVIQKAGANRELAARAHYRTGRCYEKLGQREAAKSYENIVKNFADQRR